MKRTIILSLILLAAEILNTSGAFAFTDVPEGHYAANEIQEVTDRGFMLGVDDGFFDPDSILTRAQIVTILWRLDGSPEVSVSGGFYDVDQSAWYAEPMSWAADHRIVFGYEGFLCPNDPMTREALSAILYRHSEEEYRVPGHVSIPDGVSAWAAIPFEWAAASNIMSPADPQGFVSRAGMAIVLCDYIHFLDEREAVLNGFRLR